MLKHEYHDGDEQPNRDISHEYRGHGVSGTAISKVAFNRAVAKGGVDSKRRNKWYAKQQEHNKAYEAHKNKYDMASLKKASFHQSMASKYGALQDGNRRGSLNHRPKK